MRLYINSHGRAGISFGALGCLVYAFGAVIVGVAAALAVMFL